MCVSARLIRPSARLIRPSARLIRPSARPIRPSARLIRPSARNSAEQCNLARIMIAGRRGACHCAFVRAAVRAAVDQHMRWQLIGRAAGAIPDTGHDWDDDPALWVRNQRFGDHTRVG